MYMHLSKQPDMECHPYLKDRKRDIKLWDVVYILHCFDIIPSNL